MSVPALASLVGIGALVWGGGAGKGFLESQQGQAWGWRRDREVTLS